MLKTVDDKSSSSDANRYPSEEFEQLDHEQLEFEQLDTEQLEFEQLDTDEGIQTKKNTSQTTEPQIFNRL